jgi:primosomal protein N' (replication factor Y)
MPKVQVVDMRVEFLETKRQSTFSRALLEEMQARLQNGEQTMLLLNRRGFSSFMVCRQCGERMICENCSVVMTLHRRDRRMLCHLCGFAEKIPEACPKCGSDQIQFNNCQPRALRVWIATAPEPRALLRASFSVFEMVISTFSSEPR